MNAGFGATKINKYGEDKVKQLEKKLKMNLVIKNSLKNIKIFWEKILLKH